METQETTRSHFLALAAGPNRKRPDANGWQDRHLYALIARGQSSHEHAMRLMLTGWAVYADAHRKRFESGIGEDYVLGPEWERIGRALRGLLDGETGRFDCGTLDSFLLDSLKAEGFPEEPEAT